MQSNFTYTLDALKRINGNVSSDYDIADTATTEMLKFIENSSKVLDEYKNLVRLPDGNSTNEIRNLIISMTYVMDALNELSHFHRNGKLYEVFDIARHKAEQIMQSSSEEATKLLAKLER